MKLFKRLQAIFAASQEPVAEIEHELRRMRMGSGGTQPLGANMANFQTGNAVLVGGTVTVGPAVPLITLLTSAIILYARQTPNAGALGQLGISARTNGGPGVAQFTLLSDAATDVSDVRWLILAGLPGIG